VYQNIAGVWTQIGNDINGVVNITPDESGKLSLSDNGNIVAIGSFLNNVNTGLVKVYENIAGVWTQIGNTLFGENISEFFGSYVSLSANGNILAVGAPGKSDNGIESGQVRAYQYIAGVWTQIGNSINGEAASDLAGFGLEINSTGDIMAVGAMNNDANGDNSGNVRIFKYISGNWIQIGSSILGQTAGDLFGRCISLSSDASIMAASSILNDTSGINAGQVIIYNLSTILSSDDYVLDNFVIYPNPVSETLNIQLHDSVKLEKSKIYNTLGQLIKTENDKEINVSDLSKGSYFIEVITDKGKAAKSFIVE
jgi:hypothetical protein